MLTILRLSLEPNLLQSYDPLLVFLTLFIYFVLFTVCHVISRFGLFRLSISLSGYLPLYVSVVCSDGNICLTIIFELWFSRPFWRFTHFLEHRSWEFYLFELQGPTCFMLSRSRIRALRLKKRWWRWQIWPTGGFNYEFSSWCKSIFSLPDYFQNIHSHFLLKKWWKRCPLEMLVNQRYIKKIKKKNKKVIE